jgi:hypothetical protein
MNVRFGMRYVGAAIAVSLVLGAGGAGQNSSASELATLLPRVAGWTMSEAPQRYGPQTLYEYIDGAAEAYINYDFKEAVIGQFRTTSSKASVTVELYDMGTALNAFGIYGAERSPDGPFLPVGVQGYLEDAALNFFAGRFYIKLMGYDGGDKTADILKTLARDIAAKVKDGRGWPERLAVFPKEGLVSNSERFTLRSFLGYKFLNTAYAASYKIEGQEFEAVLIEGRTPEESARVLAQLTDQFSKNGPAIEKTPLGIHVKDRYLKNMYFLRAGNVLCGVIKLEDGQAALGEKYLKAMQNALAAR